MLQVENVDKYNSAKLAAFIILKLSIELMRFDILV